MERGPGTKVEVSCSPMLLPQLSPLPPHLDTPNIVVPPEVVAGREVEVSCMVPDNCPELRPELSWLGHDGLGEPTVLGRLREDEGTWVQVSLLHFMPTREANGHRLGCQASFPNTTLQFEGYASLDVKCEPGGGGVGQGGGGGRGPRPQPTDPTLVPPPPASDPPVIVEMNASVEAIEGSHVSLLCGADSNPLPLLTWMRDGSVLREAVAESLFLDLEEVTPAEDGIYACLAENAYGQENRTVGLSVMCECPAHARSGPGAERLGKLASRRHCRGGLLQTINMVEVKMERRASGQGVPACVPQVSGEHLLCATLLLGQGGKTDGAPQPREASVSPDSLGCSGRRSWPWKSAFQNEPHCGSSGRKEGAPVLSQPLACTVYVMESRGEGLVR